MRPEKAHRSSVLHRFLRATQQPMALSVAVLLLTALLTACSAQKPVSLPPQTMQFESPEAAPKPPPIPDEITAVELADASLAEPTEESETGREGEASPQEAAAAAPSPAAADKKKDDSLVVIGPDTGEPQEFLVRLAEASRRETARRRTASPPKVVITDDNLSEYAEGGKLTIASAPPAEHLEGASAGESDESYWRERVRSIRSEWREAFDSLTALEAEAAGLRRQFYSADDPFYRDAEIKPQWDRALDKLEETRRIVEESQQRLDEALAEGRRAGALPGWLREGIELEPVIPQEEEGEPVETGVVEPQVIDP